MPTAATITRAANPPMKIASVFGLRIRLALKPREKRGPEGVAPPGGAAVGGVAVGGVAAAAGVAALGAGCDVPAGGWDVAGSWDVAGGWVVAGPLVWPVQAFPSQ